MGFFCLVSYLEGRGKFSLCIYCLQILFSVIVLFHGFYLVFGVLILFAANPQQVPRMAHNAPTLTNAELIRMVNISLYLHPRQLQILYPLILFFPVRLLRLVHTPNQKQLN